MQNGAALEMNSKLHFDDIILSTIRSGKGDCIHLKFRGDSGKMRNIVIDSGPSSTAGEFRSLISSICQIPEGLDAFILTHYDEDHIGGILKTGDPGFENIYFNAYDGSAQTENLSAMQNQRLFHMLPDAQVHVSVLAGDEIHLDGAKLVIHAPTEAMLAKAMEKMEAADGQLSATSDWDRSLDELMEMPYRGADTSAANRASIVFSFVYESRRLLFCGDAWAENIPDGSFDLVKLPHHGSIRNLSQELLERLDTTNFLICADGSSHPDKQTIAKLLQRYERITVFGNYAWWMNGFLNEEDKKYICNGQLTFKLL